MQDITADSPAVLIKSQFPNLTNAQINECKARFKELDADNDGVLDFNEIKLMLEDIGLTKTHLETREWIAARDSTGKGTIHFGDFMRACFPTDPSQEPIVLKGRIAKSGLSGNAKYFEEQMRSAAGVSEDEQKRRIKAEANLRKEEREEAKREKERQASKAAFASKMSMFKQVEDEQK